MEIIGFTTLRAYTFAIPNGGKRSVVVAMKLKAEGVMSGVCDVFVSLPSAHYHGFYIEFKKEGGKLTDTQEEFCERMTHVGFLCQVFTDARVAYNAVKQYVKNEEMSTAQWRTFIRKRRPIKTNVIKLKEFCHE